MIDGVCPPVLSLIGMNNPTLLDVSDRSFSVSVETRTVDNLKEEILEKKSATFANIKEGQ